MTFPLSCLRGAGFLLSSHKSGLGPVESFLLGLILLYSGVGGQSYGSGCKDYLIVSARGTAELQTAPMGNRGFIRAVLGAVRNGENREVVYPASIDYVSGPVQGARNAISILTSASQRCPNQLFVLIGYSEGAMVVTQTLNLAGLNPSKIVSVVLYGNPYHTPNAPQNKCTGIGGSGVGNMLGGASARLPRQFTSITFDCCNMGDSICQGGFGLMMTAHLTYKGSKGEQEAVMWTVRRLMHRLAQSNHNPDISGGH